uniref:Ig-like domain-containing protein n=1 Tax=Ornithorhynchus anatinus TaxID=9258 RepID=A0A6I8MYL2_ORNAN
MGTFFRKPHTGFCEFCFTAVVISAVTVGSMTNQDPLGIRCVLLASKINNSSTWISSTSPMVSDGVSVEDLGCSLKHRGSAVAYQAIKPVEISIFATATLQVTLSFLGNVSCRWISRHNSIDCQPDFDSENRTVLSLVISKMTETQAGEYLLSIHSGTMNCTVLFAVNVKRTLRKPYFRKLEDQDSVDCVSDSFPEPVMEWLFCRTLSESCRKTSLASMKREEKVQHELLGTDIWCCARNELGRECTKLFTLDLNKAPQAPLPQFFLKIGEPLLIRCKAVHKNHRFGLTWKVENKELQEGSYFEISGYQSNRNMARIMFAFVSSVGRSDAGHYTCSSSEDTSKTALVTVLEKGFINASNTKEDYEIDLNEEFCFAVKLRAYPQISCTWTFSQISLPCKNSNLEDGYR